MSISPSAITISPAPASTAVRTADMSESTAASAGKVAPSSTVTLSAGAQAYTNAAKSSGATPSSSQSFSLPKNYTGQDLARFAKQLSGAASGSSADSTQGNGAATQGSSAQATQSDANNAQADKALQAINSSHSATISHAELLNALSKSVTSLSADATQALLSLINTNGDANINSAELLKFETTFVVAAKSGK